MSGHKDRSTNGLINTNDRHNGHRHDDDDVDNDSNCDTDEHKMPVIWRKEGSLIKKGSFCTVIQQV